MGGRAIKSTYERCSAAQFAHRALLSRPSGSHDASPANPDETLTRQQIS